VNRQQRQQPQTFDEIMESIYVQSSELLNADQTPSMVEVGITQDAVLKAGGVETETLVIGAGRQTGDPSLFRRVGEPYGGTSIERVGLRIQRVNREDWLRVTSGGSVGA
jgi:hypothetical protein